MKISKRERTWSLEKKWTQIGKAENVRFIFDDSTLFIFYDSNAFLWIFMHFMTSWSLVQSFSSSKNQRKINRRYTRWFLDFKMVTCGWGTKLSIRWAGSCNRKNNFAKKSFGSRVASKRFFNQGSGDRTETVPSCRRDIRVVYLSFFLGPISIQKWLKVTLIGLKCTCSVLERSCSDLSLIWTWIWNRLLFMHTEWKCVILIQFTRRKILLIYTISPGLLDFVIPSLIWRFNISNL